MTVENNPIVSLDKTKFSRKNKSSRNSLQLSFKNKDLELNFYSSLDPEIMNKILEQILL